MRRVTEVLTFLVVTGAVFSAVAGPAAATARPASSTQAVALVSGKPVNGTVTGEPGVSYTFTAVAGHHVTLAITDASISPSGGALQINAYDPAGDADPGGNGYAFSSGTGNVTDINFTPTAAEAGTTTVVVSPYGNDNPTGSFTLTYAVDLTGTLTSGHARTVHLKYEGQRTAYTFTAVAGHHVTLAITNSTVSPSGAALQIAAYDPAGDADPGGNGYTFTTGKGNVTDVNFTPTAAQAGTTTVVVSPYGPYYVGVGSFTLTYAEDLSGALPAGKHVKADLSVEGQQAHYTFKAVAGQSVTLSISKATVSPSDAYLQMQVYDASGDSDAGGAYFTTGGTPSTTFTPTAAEAGTTTVVISPYGNVTGVGTFTVTRTS